MAQRVRYLDQMEPLVQCVEEATPERSVVATQDTSAVGTMHL